VVSKIGTKSNCAMEAWSSGIVSYGS
jgi:hypothetical protein